MSAAGRERAAGIDELQRAGGAGRDPRDTIGWRDWVAWCAANHRAYHPSESGRERQLMLFLLHNHEERGWRRDTCAQYAREICRVWASGSDGGPPGVAMNSLLSWLGKQPRAAAPGMGAFGVDQVLALSAALQVIPTLPAGHLPGDGQVALAALLALADLAGVSPFQRRKSGARDVAATVWGQPASAFNEQSGRLVFSYAGGRLVVSRHRQPQHFHAITTALARAAERPGDDPPLLRLWPRLSRSSGAAHKSAVLQAWVNATAPRGSRDPRRKSTAAHRRAFGDWWSAAPPEDRAWLIRVAGDRELIRRVGDLAYFYTGLTTALRHATLCRLVLDEIEIRPDGLVVRVPPSKHKSGNADLGQGRQGEWLHKAVPHSRARPTQCLPHCAACALLAHLEVRRRHGAAGGDPVFPPLHTAAAVLTTSAGSAALRRVWSLAEDYLGHPGREVDVRIGTRSLRVSAATLARVAGLPVAAIQQLLDHRDPGVTELYIRVHDPYADEELVLTVRPPAALSPTAGDG